MVVFAEERFGVNHPNVARSLNNLGRLLKNMDRLSEAEPLMRRSLSILLCFERRTGHRYPHFDRMEENYIRLLWRLGRTPAEMDAEQEALLAAECPE
ncbi:hypothetical protein BH11ARM2_BH11ARM2_15950 [soil metagenome]